MTTKSPEKNERRRRLSTNVGGEAAQYQSVGPVRSSLEEAPRGTISIENMRTANEMLGSNLHAPFADDLKEASPHLSPPTPEKKSPARRRRLSGSGRISSAQGDFDEKNIVAKLDGFGDGVAEEMSDANSRAKVLAEEAIAVQCHKGMKPESPNQDDFFLIRIDDWGLYGVFDGHGPFGHHVSNFVQREFPKTLYGPQFLHASSESMPAVFSQAFRKVHQRTVEHFEKPQISADCNLSGTTASIVYHRIKERKIYVAHVGDSTVIKAKKGADGKLIATPLTKDHKPQDPAEQKRIERSGGMVLQLPGDIPHRVFQAGKLFPGLAMSRAIGDAIGHKCGVVCEPDVSEYDLESDDELLILASDGVWEFLTPQDVIERVQSYGRERVNEAVQDVCAESWKQWVDEEGDVVDDITMQLIYL